MENLLSSALFQVSINNDRMLFKSIFEDDVYTINEAESWRCALASRDGLGRTPLMVACWHGHVGVVNELILHGADMQETDNEGRSASDYIRCCGEGVSDLRQRRHGQSLLLRAAISLATRNGAIHPTKEKIPPLV